MKGRATFAHPTTLRVCEEPRDPLAYFFAVFIGSFTAGKVWNSTL
jgi:hypothetical protein